MVDVAIFTDVEVMAQGAVHTFSSAADIRVVFTCEHVASLIDQIKQHQPRVLLLHRTPEVTLRLLAQLRREVPKCNVILWLRDISPELAYVVMELGVRGVLRKTLPLEKMIECVRQVAGGDVWFEPSLTTKFLTSRSISLTRRESELVTLLAQGLRNKEVATAMGLSEASVRTYLTRLYEKVGTKNRFELALYGLKNLAQVASWQAGNPSLASSAADGESVRQLSTLKFLIVESPSGDRVIQWPEWGILQS